MYTCTTMLFPHFACSTHFVGSCNNASLLLSLSSLSGPKVLIKDRTSPFISTEPASSWRNFHNFYHSYILRKSTATALPLIVTDTLSTALAIKSLQFALISPNTNQPTCIHSLHYYSHLSNCHNNIL